MRPPAPGPHRRVLGLAVPIVLSNLSVPLLGAVDTAVMGHLPEPRYLGATAVGATIFGFIYWGFGFLRMGTTGFVAQALGAQDGAELRAAAARAQLIALAIAVVLIAAQEPIGWAAFRLIGASPDVAPLARSYFAIRIWDAPAALLNYVFLGWLLGMQRARAALALQLWMNGINVALDLLFVPVFHWGVPGVAMATLISEYCAVGMGLWLCHRAIRGVPGRLDRARVLRADRIRGTLAVNRDIFFRTICLMLAFALFTAEGARLGDLTLAANAILMNFQTFMAYALDGFAQAAEALVGGAVGARDGRAFREAVRVSTVWAAVAALAFVAAYGVGGTILIRVMTGIAEVRERALDFLPWAAVSPALSIWSFQLDGIFIGATRGADLRNAMAISLAIYVACMFALIGPLGNHGLWLAFLIFMVARAATLGMRLPRLLRAVEAGP